MSHIRIDNRSFSHMGIPDQSEFAFGGDLPPFVRKEIARKIGITYEKKKGGLGAIVSIAVSIAIPAVAPAIASSIGLSGAVAGMIGSQAIGGAIASGLVGAGLGAASTLITKQKMGQAALMGLIGGGIGGYTQAAKAAEVAAAGGIPNVSGPGIQLTPDAGNYLTQQAGVPLGAQAGTTGAINVADDILGAGVNIPQAGGAGGAGVTFGAQQAAGTGIDLGSALSSAPGVQTAGATSAGLNVPSSTFDAAVAAGTAPSRTFGQVATDAFGSAKDAVSGAFSLPKDARGIAELTQRAAGMLAGSALSDEGLSDEQRDLVRAQANELRQLQASNEGLFQQRLSEANEILGGAKYYDPNYFGLQAQQATTTAIERQRQEALRGISPQRAGLRESTARRYALEGATRGQTAYLQGADTAARNRISATQAGLAALPTSGPAPYNTGSSNYQQMLSTAEDQRRRAQEDIGKLFGSFTGGSAATSQGQGVLIMALNLGRLAAGAGVVGSSMRAEEEAQRVARQNQLKIEEQNRLNQFRRNELGAQLPVTPATQPAVGYEQYINQFPVEEVPVEVPQVPVEQAPVVPQVGTQTVTQPASAVWDTRQPMSVVAGKQPAGPTPQQLRVGLTPPSVVTQAAKKPQSGAITSDDMMNLAYLTNAPVTPPTPVKAAPDLTKVGTPTEIPGARRNLSVAPEITTTTPAAVAVADPQVAQYFAALEQQNGIPQGVLAAIMQQESGGKAGQVSKAGAKGYFQFMDDTAKQYGVTVNDLGSEAQGAARLIGDLYRKYNGDMTKVLAGYNWGQGNVDRKGMDKAPKETRDYIASVGAAISPAAAAETQVSIVPTVSSKVGDLPAPKEQKKIADFYLANPTAINEDTNRAMRQRNELVRLATSYQNAGMGLEYTGVRAKIMELDESMYYLQGMQGLNELAVANDPRRLSAVWSRALGQPVGIQPRTDGTFNVFINGNKVDKPLTASEISSQARSSFDANYVKQINEFAIGQNTEAYKAQFAIAVENAKQLGQMIRESAVENIKGVNSLNVEKLKSMNYDVKPTGRGDGSVIVTPPFGGTPYFFNPEGKTIEIDGVKITSNAAYPIAGLPSLSGLPQIAR